MVCFRSLLGLGLLDCLDTTSDESGSAGGNETDLLAARGVSGHGRWVTDVLVVTTTMRMLDWVHRNTSHTGPL